MSWFELPHPDNLFIGFEHMHPRVRWLLTIFMLLIMSFCWYITAYRPLQQLLNGYQASVELMRQHAEQLPQLHQQIARAQLQSQELEAQISKVDLARARQVQPCVWVYKIAQQHELLLTQCSLKAAKENDAINMMGIGSLGALQDFMKALHGLHTGWAFESFSIKESSRSEEDVQLFTFNGILSPIQCSKKLT